MAELSHEFLASATFDTNLPWQFENTVPHGEVLFHWFFSGDWVAVAVSDRNNHWLGSAWGDITDARKKYCVVRDDDSAELLKDSLADVQEEFVRQHTGFLAILRIFFSFIFKGREKNMRLIKMLRLCELWKVASQQCVDREDDGSSD